jgi:hypothetical protein
MTAINFPDSPSNGDTHVVGGVTYTYDSTETKWKTTINSNAFLPLTGGTVSGNIVLGGEIQHSGDTDTNISFDTDTIKFDTAGSERFRVDSSGRLGIGSAAPTNKLVVASSGVGYEIDQASIANTNLLLSYDRGASAYRSVANYYGGTFTWNDGGAERARIDSSGNFKFNSGYGSAATAYGVRAWVLA